MAGPREHLKFYDKFKDLITRKVTDYSSIALLQYLHKYTLIKVEYTFWTESDTYMYFCSFCMSCFFLSLWILGWIIFKLLKPRNLLTLKAEADVDQFMLEGHKFPRFAKVRMFLVFSWQKKRIYICTKMFCFLVSGSGKVC